MDLKDWRLVTFLTAFYFPGILFIVFFVLNLLLWAKKSTGAVPFGTMFAVLVLWFGVSVPLVFAGAQFGYRRPKLELPVTVRPILREIPLHPWYMSAVPTCLVGGILPFGAVFTELFFILTSLWLHQVYYLFGFLALTLVILAVTCAEISIVMVYFQLTTEDYNWWWRSFFVSGSSAFYMFLYSGLYFSYQLRIEKTIPTILYFGYMSLISGAFGLLTGAIGLLAALFFVKAIYSSIKVD